MLRIKKLKRPYRSSGYELKPGETTKARGLTIVNLNSFSVYVDKFTNPKIRTKK